MPVNMAALPANLAEAILFGHEKGSFTGADSQQKGWCELADGGTLFLDEIGEMELPLQAKLLRFLQERQIQRVGSNRPLTVDVRIVAATNRDPHSLIREGRLRDDLYYRLNVLPIELPPLCAPRRTFRCWPPGSAPGRRGPRQTRPHDQRRGVGRLGKLRLAGQHTSTGESAAADGHSVAASAIAAATTSA